MAGKKVGERIDALMQVERWKEARKLIESALTKAPDDHWLLTQLGETYYEQREYKKALGILLRSRELVADCPLTLWHLAGTLDALGDPTGAIHLYTWLLRSKKTPADDPCWEDPQWTDALKTDCIFRMGLCFKHANKNDLASYCIRQYIDLCLSGAEGSYSLEEASQHLHEAPVERAKELTKTAQRILRTLGEKAAPTNKPPELDFERLQQMKIA